MVGIIFTFFYYRGIKWKKSNFIFLILFNTLLLIISINPDSINILRDMLALKSSERGRLLSLLILSVIVLVLALVYLKSRLDFHIYQFDHLVRFLGKEDVFSKGGEIGIKSVMIVIPSYNEYHNLEELMPRLPTKIGDREIGALIVDDGSTDKTVQLKCPSNCLFVRNPINRGGGAALRLGYDILLHYGVEICVTMDADNQHSPGDLPGLLEPILAGQADIVIGSRVLGKSRDRNRLRNTGVRLFNFIISRLLKQKVTDCSSGFRAFNTAVLQGIDLKEAQYHTTEMIIEAAKKGYRLTEVPITIHRRTHGHSKKGGNFKYASNFFRVILKTWWR